MTKNRCAGFGLMHLVLMLAGFTTLASLAIPGWFGRSEVTLNNAARLLARDVRDAQDRAAFQHRHIRMVFEPDGDGYSVVDADGASIEAPVGNGTFVRRYSKDAVFRGVRIEALDLGAGNMLRFSPYGEVSPGGSVVVTFGGEQRLIEIEPITGDLRVDGALYSRH